LIAAHSSVRTHAYVGLGSNLEVPAEQVSRAFGELSRIPDTRCIARSGLYVSAPMGLADQPDFINAAAALVTGLDARGLLIHLHAIERAHGRERRERWGPRTLDLDLLIFGETIMNTRELVLPHPEICNRDFVLIPLHEIAPELGIPGRGALADLIPEHSPEGLTRWEGDAPDFDGSSTML
jgi:2-amino-4-hydroxy-6-hydroxymethyldihydropteridine diphosphokinase